MPFENLLGNSKVKDILNNSLENDNILHSYLFVGIEGIGKQIFAKEFAKNILCEKNDKNNSCKSCLAIQDGNHPDFMIIEPDGKNIKIEQIRYMQKKIAEKPILSNKKIYIINDSQNMTEEAQNCLLKTLEEPPEYAIIILISSNESKLLNTIKSRCTKEVFNRIKDEDIKKYLKEKNNIDIKDSELQICEGSIGKAISLQENKEEYKKIEYLIQNIKNIDLIDMFDKAEVLYKAKEKIFNLLDYMNILIYSNNKGNYINAIQYVENTKKRLLSNANYDMCIDYLLVNIWEEINEKYSRS